MRCAYVTLVMLDDGYVKGSVALAKSLLMSGTKHELVCLVTKDVVVTDEVYSLYTHVIVVPYLYFKCPRMLTERQRQLYEPWMDYSFTKWRCIGLEMYDKCVYLDADQIVLRNIDHLFYTSRRYAMCFNHNYRPQYKALRYGDVVTSKMHESIMRESDFLGFTGTLVYTPDATLLSHIVSLLTPRNRLLCEPRYNNGFDEVVLAQAFVDLNINVMQLTPMYVWNAGDYTVLNGSQPYVVNYYGDVKPWKEKSVKFMDVYIWKYFYQSSSL